MLPETRSDEGLAVEFCTNFVSDGFSAVPESFAYLDLAVPVRPKTKTFVARSLPDVLSVGPYDGNLWNSAENARFVRSLLSSKLGTLMRKN